MRAVQVLVLLACVAAASANPWRWKTCPESAATNWGHPNSDHDRHSYVATADNTITLALLARGKPVATYCPGKTYTIRVTLPELRAFALTTSFGSIAGSAVCSGKRINVPQKGSSRHSSKTFTAALTLPKAVPSAIAFKITSAKSSSGQYRHNSLTVKRGKC